MRQFISVVAIAGMTVGGCDAPGPRPGPGPTAAVKPAAGKRDVELVVHQIMLNMSRTLAKAEHMRFRTEETVDRVLEGGHIASLTTNYDVHVRKPDHLFAHDETRDHRLFYDGATLTLLDEGAGVYGRAAFRGRLEAMFDFAMEQYSVTLPLAELLAENPYDALMGSVLRGVHVGMHTADGEACYHFAFEQQDADWQIWIRREPPILPRQVVIQHKQLPGQPRFAAILKDWDLGTASPDTVFAFQPPTGSREASMAELLDAMEDSQ